MYYSLCLLEKPPPPPNVGSMDPPRSFVPSMSFQVMFPRKDFGPHLGITSRCTCTQTCICKYTNIHIDTDINKRSHNECHALCAVPTSSSSTAATTIYPRGFSDLSTCSKRSSWNESWIALSTSDIPVFSDDAAVTCKVWPTRSYSTFTTHNGSPKFSVNQAYACWSIVASA